MAQSSNSSASIVNQYQNACNLTESPIKAEDGSLARWEASFTTGLAVICHIAKVIQSTNLDAIKKFAAYGRTPADLKLAPSMDNWAHTSTSFGNLGTDIAAARLLHGVMGVNSEVEELNVAICDAFKRMQVVNGQTQIFGYSNVDRVDKVNVAEEVGDILWYLGLILNVLGLTFEEIMQQNNDKLMLRYAKQKADGSFHIPAELGTALQAAFFTPAAANNRDLVAERAQLEESLTPKHRATVAAKPQSLRKFCSDCGDILNHKTGPAGIYSYCPRCDSDDDPENNARNAQQEIIDNAAYAGRGAPIPDAYCNFCDQKGHERKDCPQMVTPEAAPLLVESIDTAPACKHPTTKLGRRGQRVCTVCNQDLEQATETKPGSFGFGQ